MLFRCVWGSSSYWIWWTLWKKCLSSVHKVSNFYSSREPFMTCGFLLSFFLSSYRRVWPGWPLAKGGTSKFLRMRACVFVSTVFHRVCISVGMCLLCFNLFLAYAWLFDWSRSCFRVPCFFLVIYSYNYTITARGILRDGAYVRGLQYLGTRLPFPYVFRYWLFRAHNISVLKIKRSCFRSLRGDERCPLFWTCTMAMLPHAYCALFLCISLSLIQYTLIV